MKIKHLTLDCANLQEQKYFYTNKFAFDVVEESDESITLQMGDSKLTFLENRLKKSYYHFAVNIPFDSINKALHWLDKKVDIIETKDGKIQDFSNWKALAIYFLDPAGNVVEFIGRERIKSKSRTVFNEKDIINISEVGVPVFQVSEAFKIISQESSLQKFDCDASTFCASGDDEGLFIIVDKAEKTWFPTDEAAKAYPLKVLFENEKKTYTLRMESGMLGVEEEK
ncbi:putative ring-cleavage extradiol dioxygenase [Owenweeksia hongkongensis DSM 17368]|uniref:Putative ring-cleavage extradiol dioxygenase n=1 Tax=Owenweeksia hongkongensis (strain DSM 17368 / CIP 108786 / JCM 12287 / NRRL B-23963 / UST20020801) TaxID=926562 RepID=G8R8D1_OWEHD|nr:VOC family protein [Owenweeksia hongkongensis]AEV33524.1 putative ring-cleavage extradiol dioxygenase [Owenweeksia hongkongensis DSM 17368]